MKRARREQSFRGFAARLFLALALLLSQHGALLHAFSHAGVGSDPYTSNDSHAPPGKVCDFGVLHAALDGELPVAAPVIQLAGAEPLACAAPAAAVLPSSFLPFHSRAPPAAA